MPKPWSLAMFPWTPVREEREGIADRYALESDLYDPERTILAALSDELPAWSVLDIGIGGGRTTLHLAPRARDYFGIDYSEKMIQRCRRRFPHLAARLFQADARELSAFGDGSFDFVLFSFNGLDYLRSLEERLLALREMRRVLRAGGMLAFSSHNLGWAGLSRFRPEPGMSRTRSLVRYCLVRAGNFPLSPKIRRGHCVLHDGSHFSTIANFYILPEEQIGQLHAVGFGDVAIYSASSGVRIASGDDLTADPWLYYTAVAGRRVQS